MSRRRIAITGLGILAPNGLNTEDYWASLIAGRSGVRTIESFDTSEYPCRIGGEIRGFDPEPYFKDSKLLRRTDRFVHFAMAASIMAMKDSGLELDKEDLNRIGVIIGTGIGGLDTMEKAARKLIAQGPSRVSPFVIPGMMANAAGALVSIEYGLRGPNYCPVSACATSAHAVGEASRMIRDGITDICLAGGSEATVTPLAMAGFSAMRAVSLRNDSPEQASRPFDRDRDGFVMGEGSGILVLEELEHAKKRGARIYAELGGYGQSADAWHLTQPHPEGQEVANAMRFAMQDAGVETVDYINAHATSTPIGDICETNGIKRALGDNARKVAVSSTKSMTGHLLGAAGAIELAACVLAVNRGVVPPTINLDNPDPECDLDYVPHTAREMKVRAALNNSFGFGGHNASIVVKEFVD